MTAARMRLEVLDRLAVARVFLDDLLMGALMATPAHLEALARFFRDTADCERRAQVLESIESRAA